MSALDVQVGGNHYNDGGTIQPVQYIEANGLTFLEGCVVKRVTRHNRPTGKGRQDIEKAIHELQLLLELRYPTPAVEASRAPTMANPDPAALPWPDGAKWFARDSDGVGYFYAGRPRVDHGGYHWVGDYFGPSLPGTPSIHWREHLLQRPD